MANGTRPQFETTDGIRHHRRDECDGHPCPFHGPSLHAMVEEPMILRLDWGVPFVERACKHGIGHPDPDSIAWLDRNGHPGFGVHGCDGCCHKLERTV
jgi:hypothetical protein